MPTPVQLVIEGRDESKGAFGSAQSNLSKIGQIAAGILTSQIFTQLANQVINFGKSVLTSAMESQDVLADLNATIASTGGVAGVTSQAAQDLANSLQNVTRFGDESILKGESMLLTFTKIGQDVFPQATEAMLNMATKFKTDASQAAIQLGKALNDPIEGVGALRRVGVALTDEQEKQIKSFMAVGDIASAQKVILGELETEFGGLARAAGQTFAGKMDILKNRLDNVKETIGLALIPILENLMDKFTPLIPVIEDIANKISMVFGGITEAGLGSVEMWDAIGNIIGQDLATKLFNAQEAASAFVKRGLDFISGWWAKNGSGISSSAERIFGGMKVLFQRIAEDIGPLISQVFEKLSTWFTENGPLIQETVRKIADNFNTYLVPIILTAWETIQPILTGFVDLILNMVTLVMQIFTGDWAGAWETAKNTVVGVFESLIQAAMNLISGLLAIFGTSVPEIGANIQAGFENAKNVVVNTFENMKLSISTKFAEIKATIDGKIADTINGIRAKISQFQTLGSNMVGAIKTGISNAWGSFVDWIIGMVQSIIDDLIAAATGGGTSGSGTSSNSTSQSQSMAAAIARVTNNSNNAMWNFGTIYNGNNYPGMNVLDSLG